MFNVSIAGRLTKDAEYKKAGAYDLAAFTIAVSHGTERTSFIDCQVSVSYTHLTLPTKA